MSYDEASYHKATKGAQFLIDLLPRYSFYVEFFTNEVRKVILVNPTSNQSPPYMCWKKKGLFTEITWMSLMLALRLRQLVKS